MKDFDEIIFVIGFKMKDFAGLLLAISIIIVNISYVLTPFFGRNLNFLQLSKTAKINTNRVGDIKNKHNYNKIQDVIKYAIHHSYVISHVFVRYTFRSVNGKSICCF